MILKRGMVVAVESLVPGRMVCVMIMHCIMAVSVMKVRMFRRFLVVVQRNIRRLYG